MILPSNLKKDKEGLFYLNRKDIIDNMMSIRDYIYRDGEMIKSSFYRINGNNDYVVKKYVNPIIKQEKEFIPEMLKQFQRLANELENIDLPIGYFKDLFRVKGFIIPYYQDAVSIMHAINEIPLDSLKSIYCLDDDKFHNLFLLIENVLLLIEEMYNHGMYYYDINTGNFLIYNKSIKVIDFEPLRVVFKENSKTFSCIVFNYLHMINEILYKYHIEDYELYDMTKKYENIEEKVKNIGNNFGDVKTYVKKIENRVRKG